MRTRLRRLLIPAMAGLLAAACGDDPIRAPGAIEGTWQLADGEGQDVYLRIQEAEIEVFTEDTIADCFDRILYEILEPNGTQFRITSGPDTFTVELRREDEELRVTAFGVDDEYVMSSVDLTSLPLCAPTGITADCAALPQVSAGMTVDGALAVTDERNVDGSRYDLVGLTLPAPTSVVIEMASSEVDSYLVLYDSTGAFLYFNDDASNLTLDARLTPSLDAGCFMIMTTSAFPDEFGAYELTVSTP